MTRGPAMAETRWSMDSGTPADINDVESTSTAPPISSYQAMYRHAAPAGNLKGGAGSGATGPSPEHALVTPMPSAIAPSTVFEPPEAYGFSPSDWAHRNHHQYPVDVARVQIKPNATNSVSSSDSDIYKRSVNERLDKYMVIRQRTFHGLIRSKSDLRRLPLTDPRETLSEGSTPTWLHRSKTDLYIEKWRSKSNGKNRQRSKSGSSAFDLSGMTVGSLFESLPKSRNQKAFSLPSGTSRKEVKFSQRSIGPAFVSNGSETRFPPLPSNPMKQTFAESKSNSLRDRDRVGAPAAETSAHTPTPSPTKGHRSTSPKKAPSPAIFVLPSEHESEKNNNHRDNKAAVSRLECSGGEGEIPTKSPPATDNDEKTQQSPESPKRSRAMGQRLQKKPLAAIPLQVWEPSFECAVVSNQKALQPRHLVRGWQSGTVQHGVLK